MKTLMLAAALITCGCSNQAELDKAKAEAERARQEVERVKLEAEVVRLKAQAGTPETKSFLTAPITGKWQSTVTSSHTLEFFPDGTFLESTRLVDMKGKYLMLGQDRVRTVTESWLGDSVVVWKLQIDGDRLTMTNEGGGFPFSGTRVR